MNYDWEHLLITYRKHVKPTDLVIEIGASILDRTRQLSKSCRKIIGIELFANRVPQAKDSKIEYLVSDWQSLSKSLPKNSVDLAISSHVIEHVPDDLLALRELYKILKPGAVAIFNTPNRLRLARTIIEVFTGPKKFPWWEHVREYSYDDIIKLCNDSPFNKFSITPVVFGFHNGFFKIYLKRVPKIFIKYSNYWEIKLIK